MLIWRRWDRAAVKFARKLRRVAYGMRDATLWVLTAWILLMEARYYHRRFSINMARREPDKTIG